VSVGFSVRVPPGSTLVLYPYDELDINPFNSSTEYRASLSPDRVPEKTLREARRIEIHDAPGDVIVFRGHAIWHLRERPANTVMLYLKLNAYHCDPLGEDARTPEFRRHTEALLQAMDAELAEAVPILGRRVDYIHRRFTRDWREVIGVVLYGEKHFTIDEMELQMLRRMDGRQPVRAILHSMGERGEQTPGYGLIRRLAARGVIDLLPTASAGSPGAATVPVEAQANAPTLVS
jgi:hypothetical protein